MADENPSTVTVDINLSGAAPDVGTAGLRGSIVFSNDVDLDDHPIWQGVDQIIPDTAGLAISISGGESRALGGRFTVGGTIFPNVNATDAILPGDTTAAISGFGGTVGVVLDENNNVVGGTAATGVGLG